MVSFRLAGCVAIAVLLAAMSCAFFVPRSHLDVVPDNVFALLLEIRVAVPDEPAKFVGIGLIAAAVGCLIYGCSDSE